MSLVEFIFRADGRSVTRTLNEIARQSDKTTRTVKRNADTSATGFDRMGRSAHGLRGAVGTLAGTFGLGGLAFGLKDVVSAGITWQKEQTNLQGALRNTGLASRSTLNQLNEAATRLSEHGGFGAKENVHALAQLVTSTGSTSKSIRDMSVATDIARRTGRDYNQVVKAIALAEHGHTTALTRLGIALPKVTTAQDALKQAALGHRDALLGAEAAGVKLTAQQKASLALHNQITPQMRAQAQAQDQAASSQGVIAALQGLYGGQTGVFSGSTAGRLSNLSNTLKELEETTGKNLLPVVNKLAAAAVKVITLFGKLPTPLKLGIVGLTLLIPLLAGARFALGVFGSTLRGLRSPFSSLHGAVTGSAGASNKAKDAATGAAGQVLKLREAATLASDALYRLAERGAVSGGLGGGGGARGKEGKEGKGGGALAKLLTKIPGGGKLAEFAGKGVLKVGSKFLGAVALPATIGATALNHIPGLNKHVPGWLKTASSFIGFAHGGIVPRRFAQGGPAGTDTIPGWLSPGEGVVTRRGMGVLGQGGLAALNAGHAPASGHGEITWSQPLILKVDGRVLAEAVTRAVLRKAARGPSSLSGGSLMAGPGHAA